MQNKILIIEDEHSIATLLSYNLVQAGFETVIANDGREGYELALSEKPALIVLDLMLPSMDGVDVCKALRQEKVNIPIIMLTAKDDEFDKVLGLELGADDYMTKPFSPREVVARIKAVLRRSATAPSTASDGSLPIILGDLKVFPDRFEVYLGERQLEFTPKEFELLVYLMENKNRVLTRDQLLSAVWKYDFAGDTRIVDVHISHLRDKIEVNSRKPVFIKTIRGLGYKLEEPKAG
ncbi:response regulator transcription factor [Planococcus sp. FY231025]|uniref:response regulator transcription factor n=1 Tax=Planococcus sp. FY231025 TaxID=3455699 RepID=UPI003F934686